MTSLREEGFADVTLWVLRENQDARQFYEAKGFEADGATKVDTRRDGAEHHEICYRLSLGQGPHTGGMTQDRPELTQERGNPRTRSCSIASRSRD